MTTKNPQNDFDWEDLFEALNQALHTSSPEKLNALTEEIDKWNDIPMSEILQSFLGWIAEAAYNVRTVNDKYAFFWYVPDIQQGTWKGVKKIPEDNKRITDNDFNKVVVGTENEAIVSLLPTDEGLLLREVVDLAGEWTFNDDIKLVVPITTLHSSAVLSFCEILAEIQDDEEVVKQLQGS